MIRTLEEARQFVLDKRICSIFAKDGTDIPSLWDHVDLPEKQPGEKGWGERVSAVWTWKNQLPAEFPTEIFYGKIKGGTAVLMAMDHLADVHFPAAHVPPDGLDRLARVILGKIELEPWDTTALRRVILEEVGGTKSAFATALTKLQVTLNIVRLNDPDVERDTWVPFREQYLDIWARHVDPGPTDRE